MVTVGWRLPVMFVARSACSKYKTSSFNGLVCCCDCFSTACKAANEISEYLHLFYEWAEVFCCREARAKCSWSFINENEVFLFALIMCRVDCLRTGKSSLLTGRIFFVSARTEKYALACFLLRNEVLCERRTFPGSFCMELCCAHHVGIGGVKVVPVLRAPC